jgi:hypothetical protein
LSERHNQQQKPRKEKNQNLSIYSFLSMKVLKQLLSSSLVPTAEQVGSPHPTHDDADFRLLLLIISFLLFPFNSSPHRLQKGQNPFSAVSVAIPFWFYLYAPNVAIEKSTSEKNVHGNPHSSSPGYIFFYFQVFCVKAKKKENPASFKLVAEHSSSQQSQQE